MATVAQPEPGVRHLTLSVPGLYPHQQALADRPERFKVARWGRRTGKSVFGFNIACVGHGPVCQDGSPLYKGLAQGYDVLWIGRSHDQARGIWRSEVKPRFEAAGGSVNDSLFMASLPQAGRQFGSLLVRSQDRDSIKNALGLGDRVGQIICDEVAHWDDAESTWLEVLLPILTDNLAAATFLSTTEPGSWFNSVCTAIADGRRQGWAHSYATARENPRITRQAFDALVAEYEPDDPRLRKEVFAELTVPGGGYALIKWEWLDAAAKRYDDVAARDRLWGDGRAAYGVDVAQSEKGDLAAVAVFRGAVLEEVIASPCRNATRLGTLVWGQALQAKTVRQDGAGGVPACIGVDSVGLGTATANELQRLAEVTPWDVRRRPGAYWSGLNGGGKPMKGTMRAPNGEAMEWVGDAGRYKNLRAQMHWQLREDLQHGRIALTRDPLLWEELTAIHFEDDGPYVKIEEKVKVKERIHRSPDRADAVIYANWVRSRQTHPADLTETVTTDRDRTWGMQAPRAPVAIATTPRYRVPHPSERIRSR